MAKIVIVGGVAGGATAAARLRRLDENAEIIILERGEHISFANCGLPYYIGEVISDRQALFLQTPERMKAELNVEVRVFSEVTAVDPEARTVTVESRDRGTYQERYDRLLLAPGARPVRPPIEGIGDERILTLRNVRDADLIRSAATKAGVRRAVIVGGGFIGVEMAENLRRLGLEVTLVEALPHILAPFDSDMVVQVERELRANGVNLALGDGVARFVDRGRGLSVVLSGGLSLEADLVVLAIGVAPDTAFLRGSGLALGPKGHILVNERLETSSRSIFAVGDAVEVRNLVTGGPAAIPLAGPANRQARIAADNLAGRDSVYTGALGTAVIKIFSLTAAVTGANEQALTRAGLDFQAVVAHAPDHAGYYPGARSMAMKLLFGPEGRLLGSQLVGTAGVDKRLDVIATAMRLGGTVRDLVDLELAYAPPFSSAKDPVNILGYVAENVLNGLSRPISYAEFRTHAPDEFTVLDVRSPAEYAEWHLPAAVNIPLDQLRSRLNELDRSRPVVVYCKIGRRSYLAARILSQNGFEALGLSGGSQTIRSQADG